MFGYMYLMISVLVTHTLERLQRYAVFKKTKYHLSSKVILCQSLGRHKAHLLVQEPDKYMIEATADTGTLNTLRKVQQTFRHSNLTSYFSSSLVSYPSLCN